MPPDTNPQTLIQRHLLGEATESEVADLDRLLTADPALRRHLLDEAAVDAGLREIALERVSSPSAVSKPTVTRGSQWRPLAAAAAGIAFGVFGASMVWAYAVPFAKSMLAEKHLVVSEGFETANMEHTRGFPRRAGVWSGDLSQPVAEANGIHANRGGLMARLNTSSKRRLAYAWHIMDLAEQLVPPAELAPQLEVTAWFASASSNQPVQHQIRLAAFAQAPAEVRAIWNNEPVLFDTVLQHVARNEVVPPGETGWQRLRATLDIPPGTRSVVISLAAGLEDGSAPAAEHFIDNIRARFVVPTVIEH